MKHQCGTAALPRQLKDAVDLTALQLTVQQHSMAKWKRRGRRDACIGRLFAGQSGFTGRMCAGLHIHQPIVGSYNSTPVTVPARLQDVSEFSAIGRGRPGWYRAYVLAYDAARFACIALLAQQGLRATTGGGHYAVEQSVRAQFGDGFRPFGSLRRRRNELEYPHLPADTATSEEAEQAAGTAHGLIAAAGRLLPQLAYFSQNQELGDHRRTCGMESCMLPAFADSFATVSLSCAKKRAQAVGIYPSAQIRFCVALQGSRLHVIC